MSKRFEIKVINMGTTIFVKHLHGILGEISFGGEPAELGFTVPIDDTNFAQVKILPHEKEVVTLHKKDISDKMWEFLQSGKYEIPTELETEVGAISTEANKSVRNVMTYIKYHLGQIELNEQPISHKDAKWSTDNTNWHSLPLLVKAYAHDYGIHPLNTANAVAIQQFINYKIEPFLALRHLHKARNESLPHYKWIDATIAAELAIKEFLIKLKPEIATLLLEIPSPPLQKLYGSVLESLGFERSPKLKEIAKGVEVRNKLVHRPEEIRIDIGEANKYVRDIEIAIHHLIISLYPDNQKIEYYYHNWADH